MHGLHTQVRVFFRFRSCDLTPCGTLPRPAPRGRSRRSPGTPSRSLQETGTSPSACRDLRGSIAIASAAAVRLRSFGGRGRNSGFPAASEGQVDPKRPLPRSAGLGGQRLGARSPASVRALARGQSPQATLRGAVARWVGPQDRGFCTAPERLRRPLKGSWRRRSLGAHRVRPAGPRRKGEMDAAGEREDMTSRMDVPGDGHLRCALADAAAALARSAGRARAVEVHHHHASGREVVNVPREGRGTSMPSNCNRRGARRPRRRCAAPPAHQADHAPRRRPSSSALRQDP